MDVRWKGAVPSVRLCVPVGESSDGWLAACVLNDRLLIGSYKRVKGRSHTAEKRISMHPHRPNATTDGYVLISSSTP